MREKIEIGSQYICYKDLHQVHFGGDVEFTEQGSLDEIVSKLKERIHTDFELGMITPKVIENDKFKGIVLFEEDANFKYLGIKGDIFLDHFKPYRG